MVTAASCVAATDLRAQCPDGSPPPCRLARPSPPPHSVAVLYFDNLSRDSTDLYLADGITEEIIARVSQVERLAVKSRYAVRRFRGRPAADPAGLGRALGVTHLVTGSLQRAGPRLRVRVELVIATSGTRLWGDTYDRPAGDVLAIEDDIAQAVAGEVIGRLAPAERLALTARPTRNAEAYDHYLKGTFYLSRRTSEVDGRRALEEYEAAVRLDPGFAAAYGRLGLVYGIYASWPWPYRGLPFDSLVARGLAAANRAIALDSTSSDGWLARGFLLIPTPTTPDGWRGFQLAPTFLITSGACPATAPSPTDCRSQALSALARAVRLDPRNAEGWYQYGRANVVMGNLAAADSAILRSLALDPHLAVSAWLLGMSYLRQHRFADARTMVDSAIALGRRDVSVRSLRMQAALAQGDVPSATAELDTIGTILGGPPIEDTLAAVFYGSMRVVVAARLGDTTVARTRLHSLLARYPPESVHLPNVFVCLAAAHIAVRLNDQGITLLERASPAHWGLWGLQSPLWDSVRQDPRFRQIEEKAKGDQR